MVATKVRIAQDSKVPYLGDGPEAQTDVYTREAADFARRVAHWVEANAHGEASLEESTAFKAFRVCASRADGEGASPSSRIRDLWSDRQELICDYLVDRNLGLVYSMLTRFKPERADWDDLRSEGLFALVRAVNGYDPWRGCRFSTYACHAINRALLQAARKAARYRFRMPGNQALMAEEPAIPEEKDQWVSLFAEKLHRALNYNLGELTEREALILHRRFPLDGSSGLTLEETGDAIGLSKERVRQIQKRALEKLRGVLEADPILQ